jgi:hypothetical protein
MPAWFWWVLWSVLGIAALGFFAYLALDLSAKASRTLKHIEKTVSLTSPLLAALAEKPTIQAAPDNLLDDPAPLVAEHARNLKKRESMRADRQRRLINKLIDFNESEFKP